MSEKLQNLGEDALTIRSRALFQASLENIDMPMRSRLTQARYAALDAATVSSSQPWRQRLGLWTPAAGVAAAALLGVAMWFGGLGSVAGNHGIPGDGQTNLEDLDIVASSDPASGDTIEMLQDDIDFYDFADKASNAGPAA